MSKKRAGFVQINRKVRERIFRAIDEGAKRQGTPPRLDLARLLIYTIADHCDYEDMPEQGRQYGVWNTSYSEVAALVGAKPRQVRSILMYLKKQGLIETDPGTASGKTELRQGSGANRVRVGIVIKALFYRDITTVGDQTASGSEGEPRHVINKPLPPASPPLKSLKSEPAFPVQQVRTSGTSRNGREASPVRASLNSFFEDQRQSQEQPTRNGTPLKNGKAKRLVERKPIPIQEAVTGAQADFRPTLNLVKQLGVETVYPTQLDKLLAMHRQLMKTAGHQTERIGETEVAVIGKTQLYKFLNQLHDLDVKFDSLSQILEAVK